jgi:hypothetical protein
MSHEFGTRWKLQPIIGFLESCSAKRSGHEDLENDFCSLLCWRHFSDALQFGYPVAVSVFPEPLPFSNAGLVADNILREAELRNE